MQASAEAIAKCGRPRKERTITMKAKTYFINCNGPQRLRTVKPLIVQMINIWKK